MSLVEQAIARMRNQARAAANKVTDAASKPAAPPTIVDRVRDPAAKPAKLVTLNMETLRARGYLPEAGKDQLFADHYRRIKRPLIDKAMSEAAAVGEPRVIMITSAVPGDGKTFTSINLALSMAIERDISVLLLDCDLARRHVSDIVGLKEESGLLDALVDESVDIDSLVVQTNLQGLSILPAGRRVEAATTELLSSNRMRQVIASLCNRNPRRILLLDSPPLLITNEGRALVKIAGQIVLVVRAGHTPRQAVQEALGLFDAQQMGGIILNQVEASPIEGYFGYGSYGTNRDAT
jgi:protein-tyrosine kinase